MLATMAEGNLIIEHPNRDRPESQATRALVVGLLLVSTLIFAIATVGGWEKIQGAKPVHVAYVIIYLLLAFYIARWRSGLLPVAASVRDHPAHLLRDQRAAVVLARRRRVQRSAAVLEHRRGADARARAAAAAAHRAAARGFSQKWSVEVERRSGPQAYVSPAR